MAESTGPSPPPRPPLGGRRVVRVLGVGALTETLAVAKDGEPVRAAKRLSSRFRDDEAARAMILREAAVLCRLGGRGSPRLVEHDDTLDPYIVMDLVLMRSLAARGSSARPDKAWFALAARATMRALSLVHEASDADGPLGVLHGDISPDNVLVADDGQDAALVDFGLARWREDPGPLRGPFRGTLSFAAPEVARGEMPDRRSDLFSLAASLLATACGELPREGDDFAALLVRAGEAPIDAYAARASAALEARVARVLVACVRFEAKDRPASAREAAYALAPP
jgi:eukaryotic-like serine/threonine-protein kinase